MGVALADLLSEEQRAKLDAVSSAGKAKAKRKARTWEEIQAAREARAIAEPKRMSPMEYAEYCRAHAKEA